MVKFNSCFEIIVNSLFWFCRYQHLG